jgi:hypothetical protein
MFNQEHVVRSVVFNLKIIVYEVLLDLLKYFIPSFTRYVIGSNFTAINNKHDI